MNNALKQLYEELIAEGYSPKDALAIAQNGGMGPQMNSLASAATTGATGIRGMFGKYFNKLGSDQPLFKGNVSLPSLKGIREQQLFEGGPSIGTTARAGMGIYQGGKAIKGLMDNVNYDKDYNDTKNDISLAIASNPMYDMYLDASDEKTLRQMKNGSLTNPIGGAASGAIKGIPQALVSALIGGAIGGVQGAAINGIGSLVNSGISGYGEEQQKATNTLQGLYGKLKQAGSEYRNMKRPNNLGLAGLQSRYYNQLY